MNTSPGFCETCNTPLDPADDRRECWRCDADEYLPLWDYPDGDPSSYLWDLWTAQPPPPDNFRSLIIITADRLQPAGAGDAPSLCTPRYRTVA